MRYIEIVSEATCWRHELTEADLHNIALYGEFTRENVAKWLSGGYYPHAFEISVYGWKDFHAVCDNIDIPWAEEKYVPREGDRNPQTGKVRHSGEWWDEQEWQQYIFDTDHQQ